MGVNFISRQECLPFLNTKPRSKLIWFNAMKVGSSWRGRHAEVVVDQLHYKLPQGPPPRAPACSPPPLPRPTHLGVKVALEKANGLKHVEHGALSHPFRERSEFARLTVAHMHQSGFHLRYERQSAH